MSIVDDFLSENGTSPDDFVTLRCPTEGCRKLQVARTVDDVIRFDQCPCGFQMPDQPEARLLLFAFGSPPFWAFVHKEDAPRIAALGRAAIMPEPPVSSNL